MSHRKNNKYLSPEEVRGIRAYLAMHKWVGAKSTIARKYDVSPSIISRIASYKYYKDVK